MVLLRDVVKRHAGYLAATVFVVQWGSHAVGCTAALSVIVLWLMRDTRTSIYFFALAGVWFSLVEAVVYLLFRGLWQEGPWIAMFGIPPWAVPRWAIIAQWSMDVFCVATVYAKHPTDEKGKVRGAHAGGAHHGVGGV